jgi:membrane associated rhomboid family serine protease
MSDENQFKYSSKVMNMPILVVFLMWLVYWCEYRFQINVSHYGVFPRDMTGLRGIFFSPFIHSGIKHLFNNSIPIAVFIGMLFYFYNEIAWKILSVGSLFTGFFTWLVGAEAYHIGMSGVVYLLFSFIFFSGIIRKHFRLISVSLIVIFLYGSMFWYVFPIEKGVSWEGHLSGLLVGLVLAIYYRKFGPQKIVHQFSKTEFDLLFDENGNFNPPKEEEKGEED